MLEITIPAMELYDDEKEEFVTNKTDQTIRLEHSLVSLSKWESKWHKAFLSDEKKTHDEIMDYIKCMTLTQNVDPVLYNFIDDRILNQIYSYIDDSMTATVFYDEQKKGGKKETVTSELIYYWMVALNIPFECQKWHLNRLLTLVKVCTLKNQPAKKMSKREINSRNAALNAARRKQLNTKG